MSTTTKELNDLISYAEKRGAVITVTWDEKLKREEGRDVHQRITIQGVAGCGPYPMDPISAAEILRTFTSLRALASTPMYRGGFWHRDISSSAPSVAACFQPCSVAAAATYGASTVILQYKRRYGSDAMKTVYYGVIISPKPMSTYAVLAGDDVIETPFTYGYYGQKAMQPIMTSRLDDKRVSDPGVLAVVEGLARAEGPADDIAAVITAERQIQARAYRVKKNQEAERQLQRRGLSIR